jgi:hypothetical protein
MLAITRSELDALVSGAHPFEFLQYEGLEATLANYFAMSQAFPYLQAGSQKKLYDHYIGHNKLIDKDLEITSVVGNFLAWDETGGLNVTLRRKLASLSDILNTEQNFHSNILRDDLLKIFGRSVSPCYSRVTRDYLDRLYENLADPDIIIRTATMVSFEAHAEKMISSLWDALSKLFPGTPRDDYRYFYMHVGGDDPAEAYHVKMTEELIAFAVDTPEKRERFLKHFARMHDMHEAWCEDISQLEPLPARSQAG